MKKKITVLGALLMAVVVTGYSVAGTYAKYVSKVDLTDEARVARWNLTAADTCTADSNGNWSCKKATALKLFDESYTEKGTEGGIVYVKSLDGDKVVAPGTTGQYQVNLSGEMEVRHKFDIKFGLKADAEKGLSADPIAVSYEKDATTGELRIGSYEQYANKYNPIKFTVSFFEGNTNYVNVSDNDLAVLQTKINAALAGKEFEPAKRLGYSLRITWEWKPTNEVTGLSSDEVDALDTYMAKNLTKWVNYGPAAEDVDLSGINGNTQFDLEITATQVAADMAKPNKNLWIND